MNSDEQQDIARMSTDILQYARTHPQAADTLEGIVEWWLALPPDVRTRDRVQRALDQLVARGLLSTTALANGRTVYASAEGG